MHRKITFDCYFFLHRLLAGLTPQEWMPDPHLQRAVREKLQEFPDGIPIHPADMAGLHDLIAEHNIQRLKGLEHAINLEFLEISRCEVSELTPLAGLENLQVLKLHHNRITDISPLSGVGEPTTLGIAQQSNCRHFTARRIDRATRLTSEKQ